MAHQTFVILLGGRLVVTDRLKAVIRDARFIAADSGMRHAQMLEVKPEVWVGDFDSTPADLFSAFPDVPRQPYPPAKNETDGEIAVQTAIDRGAQRLVLAGALGGERSDHAFMHLLHAARLAEQGYDVMLTSGEEEAFPLGAGTCEIDLPKGSLFSILGLSALSGLSIANVRYPLDRFELPFGSSRTVSNVAEGPARFSLQSGRAIILARPFDFSGT